MNKQNVLFWISVNSPNEYHQEKHGGFKYFEYSEKSWRYWCDKNNVLFIPYTYDDVTNKDTRRIAPTWQRWFDVFKVLENKNINYDKICVIDASTIIRWDAPNFFDLCNPDKLTVFRSLENLRWVSEGVFGYKKFFNNFEFDLKRYFSCGFQIFGKKHKEFLTNLHTFFVDNINQILHLQNNEVKRGTDQPVYNYYAQIKGIDIDLDTLPKSYFINHPTRFDWFSSNWQLPELETSKYPHFINHSYIWFFSGFVNRGDRNQMMHDTWEIIKENYI